jgi:hypothetical protein
MDGSEKLIITDNDIRIVGLAKDYVMHIGENSAMQKLAEIVTRNGGDILELGFGMHLSADAVQSNPNVTSHTIIEVHPEIYKKALEWSKDKPNTKILLGDWIDVLPTLTDKFDGILHDTHREYNTHLLLDYAIPNCKVGTIIGFFTYKLPDNRLGAYRHSISDSEKTELPYFSTNRWKNGYELKYTIFNGKDYEKDSNITKNTII